MHSFGSILNDYAVACGILLIPLTLVCFAMWAYLLRIRSALKWALTPRAGGGTHPPRANVSEQALAYVTAQVAAGASASEAFETFTNAQIAALRRDIVILTAYAAAAPLLGLLGTVIGMVQTFNAVANASGIFEATLALGIQRALVTTQLGLLIALPGVFGAARMHRLLAHIRVTLAICRSQFLLHQTATGRTA